MKNIVFCALDKSEKRSKLARALKAKTNLADEDIINAVTKINVAIQYSIRVISKENFAALKSSEDIISKNKNWEEKIVKKVTVLVSNDDGGIAIMKTTHIGSLNLNENENEYTIFVC